MKKGSKYYLSGIAFLLLMSAIWISFSSFSLFNRKPVEAERAADIAIFSEPPDLNTYYWFELRIKIDTRNDRYQIIGPSNKIYDGYMKDFEKALWKGLAQKKVIVGPYETMGMAKMSRTIYRQMARVKEKDDINKMKWPDYEYKAFFFNIELQVSHRLRIYMLKHIAAAVEPASTTKDFALTMYNLLTYKKLAIGLFQDQDKGERAKRLYRQNE